MNSKIKAVIGLAIWAIVASGLPAQIIPEKLCRIAGHYQGFQHDDPGGNCPGQSNPFFMTIQQLNCSASNICGTITQAGVVQNFTGTLTPGSGGCCAITGKFGAPGHVTYLRGAFCMKLGEWLAKGTYSEEYSGSGCKHTGTWEIYHL